MLAWNCKERDNLGDNNIKSPPKRKGVTEQVSTNWYRTDSISGRTAENTYLLTPWSRVLLEKLSGLKLVKKFPAFYGTQKFITTFTNVHHLSLSWVSSIHSIPPHPTSWKPILILSYHLRLVFPSGLFPSSFPTETLYTSLLSLIRTTCTAHLIFLDFITPIILSEEYRSLTLSYGVPVRERYGSTLLPAKREQHDQNCTQSH